jgi:hypothetical protein
MALTDDEFIAAWHRADCSPAQVAKLTGMGIRSIYDRRKRMAEKGVILPSVPVNAMGESQNIYTTDAARAYPRERRGEAHDGSVIVFSDAHFWPQPRTVANNALLELIRELKPRRIVANGDIFDGAGKISTHPPLGWAKTPSAKEEIEACQERMHEIELVAPRGCALDWNVGNHDSRFDKKLAAIAGEYEGLVERLEDKFSAWDFAWSLRLNERVMIKHRWHNGVHATYNNALKGGLTIVTGHLHRLAVTPWADYTGHRWGVDTGTLSDPLAPQFDYCENNPVPWTSGFAVLTFKDGRLLPPELCSVIDGVAYFRGEVVYQN